MKKIFLVIISTMMIVSCKKEELDNSIITSNSLAVINSSCNLALEAPITTIESTFSNAFGGEPTCNNPIFNPNYALELRDESWMCHKI